MIKKNKIGIVSHENFTYMHAPLYPRPLFTSHENPLRVKSILDYFNRIDLFSNEQIVKLIPQLVTKKILYLTHSAYHVNLIRRLSRQGGGLLGDEVFITHDTFKLARLAAGGAIEAMKSVIQGGVNQSFALVRPPGHHAMRDNASGLCIFNNIVVAINFLRNEPQFKKKIAIIDIDSHFGDGIAQFFYEDPSILYFSIHEHDFIEGEKGFITELGEGDGLGTNINVPVPLGLTDSDFLDCLSILPSILNQFQPKLIVVACGFDFHFSDPIGNGFLTSLSYYNFARLLMELATELCEGKICFILEGGYSITALPFCVHAIIKAILNSDYKRPPFEFLDFSPFSKKEEITKINSILKQKLMQYWSLD